MAWPVLSKAFPLLLTRFGLLLAGGNAPPFAFEQSIVPVAVVDPLGLPTGRPVVETVTALLTGFFNAGDQLIQSRPLRAGVVEFQIELTTTETNGSVGEWEWVVVNDNNGADFIERGIFALSAKEGTGGPTNVRPYVSPILRKPCRLNDVVAIRKQSTNSNNIRTTSQIHWWQPVPLDP